MAALFARNMGGEIPRTDSRLLPDNMGEQAWNLDAASGRLEGLPIPELIVDLSARPDAQGVVKKAFRFPGPNDGDEDVWLPLPSPYSSVVRSPLANDTLHRLYWTNPGEGAFWNTYGRIRNGEAAYNLGFQAPSDNLVIVAHANGGTPPDQVPYVARSYLVTYVDEYGLESSPSLPSGIVEGASDATWTINGMPTAIPATTPGKHYPVIQKVNLYRTVSGQATGGVFYLVKSFHFAVNPPSDPYTDTSKDTEIVSGLTLGTASWTPPPEKLDGLIGLPGGMLIGFTGNTVHFCEVNRPHAWPAGYDLSVSYPIVGIAAWQSYLVVLTEGYPYQGTGNAPGNFILSSVQVAEPCISRGSIVADLPGVYYASQNGLVTLSTAGVTNQTLQLLSKNVWLNRFRAAHLIGARHRAQYIAINGSGTGFTIDATEQRMGIVEVNCFLNVSAVWNDVPTGDTYLCADKRIYRWDSQNTGGLVFRWRSKQFYLPDPANLGACQVSMSPQVEDPAPLPGPPMALDNLDPTLVLPPGVNAIFRLFAGGGHLVMERPLTEARSTFRLPSGFKSYNWQFEIVSRVPVYSIALASTMHELANG